MANADIKMGLVPVGHLTGGTPHRMNTVAQWSIAAAYATAIFKGDPVIRDGTISTNLNVGSAAMTACVGVFAGVEWTKADGSVVFSNYWPGAQTGATNIKAYVYDDYNTIFEVQADSGGGAFVDADDPGKTADIVYTAGSTLSGVSKVELDSSDLGTGLNLRLLDVARRPENEFFGVSLTKCRVIINENPLR